MLNNNIKGIRLKKGFTQQELACALKITPSYLSKIERGEREPSMQLMVKMANKLNCRRDELFF